MINRLLKILGISLLIDAMDCYASESVEGDSDEFFSMPESSSQSEEDAPEPEKFNGTAVNKIIINKTEEKPVVNHNINIYLNTIDSQVHQTSYATLIFVGIGSFLLGSCAVYWYMKGDKS